jgi:hypothetical protein
MFILKYERCAVDKGVFITQNFCSIHSQPIRAVRVPRSLGFRSLGFRSQGTRNPPENRFCAFWAR